MNKEKFLGNKTEDVFWEKLKPIQVEFGDQTYQALMEAIIIGQVCLVEFKLKSTPLSERDKDKIDEWINKVVNNNNNNFEFTQWFNEACRWLTCDQGTVLSDMILIKLGFLEDKIKQANERTDLV